MSGLTRKQFLAAMAMPGLAPAMAAGAGSNRPALIPFPKRYEPRSGRWAGGTTLTCSRQGDVDLSWEAARLALGGRFSLAPNFRGPAEPASLRLSTGDPETTGDSPEAYRLTVGEKAIAIRGRTSAGVLQGLRTLANLSLDGPPPACEIVDWPDMSFRAAHLCYHLVRETTAFNCPNFEALLRQVDGLAALKYNAVLLELESMFPYRHHPDIPCRIAFTQDQIGRLRQRFHDHGMSVIPMVQCLGHAYSVLMHDRYAAFREVDDGNFHQYCPTNPAVADLYAGFVDEYREAFPEARLWHMGGDECRQLGVCPRCRAKAEKDGKSRLYVDHIRGIAQRVKDRGFTPLVWSDMLEHHPEAMGDIPKYVRVVYWNYDLPKWPRPYAVRRFQENGLSVLASPAVRFGRSGTELSVYYPETLRGIETLIRQSRADGVRDIIVTNWMKGSPHELENYGFSYAADICWTTSGDRDWFNARYSEATFGLSDAALTDVYQMLSLRLPYAEGVQQYTPPKVLNRYNLTGFRFPEKWRKYTQPDAEPDAIADLTAALAAGRLCEQRLQELRPRVKRGEAEFEVLLLAAFCIRAKARFGLALHSGRQLEIEPRSEAAGQWLNDLAAVIADWQQAKRLHASTLEVSGFPPVVAFLNELMFEPAELEFLKTMGKSLTARRTKGL